MNINHFFKDTVTLYSVEEGLSTVTGENVKTNSETATIKGKLRPLTNYERYNQNKNNVEVTHRLYTAYSTAIYNIDKIGYNSQTYEVVGIIDPFNKHDFLQVDVKAVI